VHLRTHLRLVPTAGDDLEAAMSIEFIDVDLSRLHTALEAWLGTDGGRLGYITSIDGKQIITLVLNTQSRAIKCWYTPLSSNTYRSMTPSVPSAHWFERNMWDMFGLLPAGHPRLRHNLLHEEYGDLFFPLASTPNEPDSGSPRTYLPTQIAGEGIYEIPVGPIHAGIIEPAHFHLSCLGEIIFNLEIRLGYVHRGVEKKLAQTPWPKQRFQVEATASDSAAAYALAHAKAIEDLFEAEAPARARYLRCISLELERIGMHIGDIGGLAADIGFGSIAAAFGRLRGKILFAGELLTRSRLQRGFIAPGGVTNDPDHNLAKIRQEISDFSAQLKPVLESFRNNQVMYDRTQNIGKLKKRLAADFGIVGVAARASGQNYDFRNFSGDNLYPDFQSALEQNGDVLARTNIRIFEINESLKIIEYLLDGIPAGKIFATLPTKLSPNKTGLGIVESHRGELIQLIMSNSTGDCMRYAIKDASVNNWTALSISARDNLVSDFPICNKSFALAYSGHDL
jgi:Ni,Fe-hydrogenase III large subunit/Ni,Fe-hydrogenase III component G